MSDTDKSGNSTEITSPSQPGVTVLQRVRDLLRNTRGAEMAEYIVIAAIVITLIYAGMRAFGTSVSEALSRQGSEISTIATN